MRKNEYIKGGAVSVSSCNIIVWQVCEKFSKFRASSAKCISVSGGCALLLRDGVSNVLIVCPVATLLAVGNKSYEKQKFRCGFARYQS